MITGIITFQLSEHLINVAPSSLFLSLGFLIVSDERPGWRLTSAAAAAAAEKIRR